MRKIAVILFVHLSFFSLRAQSVYENYLDGQLYVKLKASAAKPLFSANARNIPFSQLANLDLPLSKYGVSRVYRPYAQANDDKILPFVLRVDFSAITQVNDFIRELEKNPSVEYAEKVPLSKTHVLPNDYAISSASIHLAQINAGNAWNVFNGNSNITVAIVDNAVMWTHADLVQNTHTNTAETPNNNIDDDNNGYIDDVNGYDVTDWDNNTIPTNLAMDHGTQCAGIAAGRTDNNTGIASIGWNLKFIPVKCQTDLGIPGVVWHGYEGILYAVKAKARVISCSWGSWGSSFTEQAAVTYAWNNGCIIIASSGNDGQPTPTYPGAYNNVYCVGAVNPSDVKTGYSNYGSWVDICAPGDNILSTEPYTNLVAYQTNTGTSMAAPMVAGLAGLMLSKSPFMTATDVLNCISSTAVNIYTISGNVAGQLGAGRIEAYQAMLCASTYSLLPPIANFYAFPPNTCPNTPVQFYDSSIYNPTSYSWVFQGGSPATSTLANPTVSWTTPGTYSVSLTVSNAAGNSSKIKLSYINVGGPQGLPFFEGFQSSQFVPAGWTAKNLHNDQIYWDRVTGIGGFGTSTACAMFDNYNFYAPAEREEMWSPKLNFSSAASVHITFDVAYARFNATLSDTLEVKVSTNCGQTWTSIYLKGGTNLSTANDQGGYFTPTSTQWRTETVNITTLTAGQGNVMFSFINRGHYGQPIYLDNINLAFPAPVLSLSTQSAHCVNQVFSHTITMSPQSAGNFTWTFPGATPSVITGSNNAFSYSLSGSYTGTLTIGNGTYVTTAPIVQQINGFPTLSVNQPTICSSNTATLSVSGGTDYVWISPTATINNSNTLAVSPPLTTEYTVSGTNGFANGGCKTTITTSVIVNPTPTLAISPQTICAGASATVSASGANNYVWAHGPTTNSFVAAPPSTTVYLVIGTTNGCNAPGVASVTVLAPVTPSISATSTILCAGDAATLTASGANSFVWFDNTNGSQVTVTPSSNTVYTLTGTTGACTGTAQISTSVIAAPVVSITSAGSTSFCAGNSVTLTASGATQYSWSTGSQLPVLIATPPASTVYTVYGSNAACTRTASMAISVTPSTVNIIVTANSNTVCENSLVTLSVTGAATYSWGTGSTNNTVAVTASTSAFYTVQGMTNGCGDSDSILITVIPYPVASVSISPASCFSTCDGAIQITNTNGVGPFSYSLNSGCTSPVCASLCAGMYTLSVSGAANCASTMTFSINQPAALQAATSFSNATCATCTDGSAMVTPSGGTSPYTYSWAPVSGTAAVLNALSQGCYTVLITDANNCTLSSSVCVLSFTGLEDNAMSGLLIFPNPGRELLNVHLPSKSFDCYLFNELGQIVRLAEQQQDQVSLRVFDLAKGIYYLEVRSGADRVREKIVID